MKRKKILWINLIGNDYETVIPAGTQSRDVEIGIAQALISIAEKEKEDGREDITTNTILRGIELWVKQLEGHLEK